MAYQLGSAGLDRLGEADDVFAALEAGDCDGAADHAAGSAWARQTARRAERVLALIRQCGALPQEEGTP